jgi:hypothetical protein
MIDTIISYCSTDMRFIRKNIIEALKFSDKVVVSTSTHLFDGTDDTVGIQKTVDSLSDIINDKVEFIQFEWDSSKPIRYNHNMSRWVGAKHCSNDYVMLLDADEIMEGDLVRSYLETGKHTDYDVVAFKCYWYFREPIYRATTTEMAASLWKKSLAETDILFSEAERWGYRNAKNVRYIENETYDNQILCHHYSWARTHPEMLRKVKTWGHRHDKNWVDFVNEEFSRPFSGKDFVHGYTYEIVTNNLN